ncbi:hypothetical protein D3C80_1531510 [compost metagenome]
MLNNFQTLPSIAGHGYLKPLALQRFDQREDIAGIVLHKQHLLALKQGMLMLSSLDGYRSLILLLLSDDSRCLNCCCSFFLVREYELLLLHIRPARNEEREGAALPGLAFQ